MEVVPQNAVDSVVHREDVVENGVVGLEEVAQAAVGAQEVTEGFVDFVTCGELGAVVEAGEKGAVDFKKIEAVQSEPLIEEGPDKSLGARVGEQPFHLSSQHLRFLQFTLRGQCPEPGVRRGAPDKIGEARGHFGVGDRAAFVVGGGFGEVEEFRGGEDNGESLLEGGVVFVAGLAAGVVEGDEPVEVTFQGGALPGRLRG